MIEAGSFRCNKKTTNKWAPELIVINGVLISPYKWPKWMGLPSVMSPLKLELWLGSIPPGCQSPPGWQQTVLGSGIPTETFHFGVVDLPFTEILSFWAFRYSKKKCLKENVVNYFLGIQVRSRPSLGREKNRLCDFWDHLMMAFRLFVQLPCFLFRFWCPRKPWKNTGRSRDRVGPQLTSQRCQLGWQVCTPWKRMAKGKMIQASIFRLFKRLSTSGAKCC